MPSMANEVEHTPEYLVAGIRDALAKDPRTSELYVNIKVVGNDIYLTGEVATKERRSAINEIVFEMAPDFKVHNETTLARPSDEPQEESLP